MNPEFNDTQLEQLYDVLLSLGDLYRDLDMNDYQDGNVQGKMQTAHYLLRDVLEIGSQELTQKEMAK